MENDSLSPKHYSRWQIEPWDFIAANNLDFLRGNVIKYIMRFDAKNGVEDLLKAKTYLEKLISVNTAIIRLPDQENRHQECRLNPKDLFLEKVLLASTGNITEEDGEILSKSAWKANDAGGNPRIVRMDGGWLVETDRHADQPFQNMPKGLSNAFNNIILNAMFCGLDYVRFDRDADPVPGFELFDW